MKKYFPRLKCYKFRFANPETERKFSQIVGRKRPGVVLYELRDMLSEFYDVKALDLIPRSKYSPEMLYEPARKYGEGGSMPGVHWSDLFRAVNRVKKLMCRVRGVKPIPLESVPFDTSTNSGLPFLARKGEVAEETLRRAKACESGACPPPYVMFSRGKNLEVARMVWCEPAEWQLVEGRFFYPLQDAILQKRTPYAAGLTSFQLGAKINALANHRFILALDYSGYDGSISSFLIDSGFKILRHCMELNEEEEALFDRVVSYFVTSPVLAPDGYVYYGKDHGVPSGSMFTQMIDSIVNMIIIQYIALRTNSRFGDFYVLGDDSVIACDTVPDVELLSAAASEIGIQLNAKKSKITDTSRDLAVHFLGHTYETGLASRPIDETLSKMLTPERIDRRIFSKSRNERFEYYIERIRAYQEDTSNPDCWRILRILEERVKQPEARRVRIEIAAEMDGEARRDFRRVEHVERDRWDPKRYALRVETYRLFMRPAVWFI